MVDIVATIRVDPSVLVFLAIISKSVNNQCDNPYIFGKILSRSLQKCIGCSIGLFTVFEIIAKNTNTEGSTLIVATIPYFFFVYTGVARNFGRLGTIAV